MDHAELSGSGCGNERLKQILTATLSSAIDLLQVGESLVEIAAMS